MADYKREVAYRIFSDALKDAESVERSDEEFAVQYIRLKTGELVNRVFIVGTLLECRDVGQDTPFYKLRISDPNGHFDAMIGQYSPSQAQLMAEDIEVPMFVAVVGKLKAREYEEKEYFSIAVESITKSDLETYERWVAETEAHTAARAAVA